MKDYIDRQAAIEAIERLILPQTKGETMAEEINRVAWRCAINCAQEVIGHLPPAEVELVKRGRWIDDGFYADYYGHHEYRCSECGECYIDYEIGWHYCPNCGAKMENGE